MLYISNDYSVFNTLTDELYCGDPFYVKPLIEDKYHFFSVIKQGKAISRACVIYNPILSFNGKKTAQIGYFESFDDFEASSFLFNEIKTYCKKEGFNFIIGPINGSTWQKYRITLASSKPPFFLDNYNKPYYSKLFESSGFQPIAGYISTVTSKPKKNYSRLYKFTEYYKKKGIEIRHFNISDFESELKKIYEISIDSFKNNFLYTPIDFDEFKKMYSQIKSFINQEWILIAEDAQNRPAAFIFAFDNIYEKGKKSLVIKTLAKISDSRVKGIGAHLVALIYKKAEEQQYDEIIHALMYDRNISTNIMSDDSNILHEYLLYGVEL